MSVTASSENQEEGTLVGGNSSRESLEFDATCDDVNRVLMEVYEQDERTNLVSNPIQLSNLDEN